MEESRRREKLSEDEKKEKKKKKKLEASKQVGDSLGTRVHWTPTAAAASRRLYRYPSAAFASQPTNQLRLVPKLADSWVHKTLITLFLQTLPLPHFPKAASCVGKEKKP